MKIWDIKENECLWVGGEPLVRHLKTQQTALCYVDGTIFDGGQTVTVDAPVEVLPYFERI